jgi:membrane-bound lytic murein transglycosylase D
MCRGLSLFLALAAALAGGPALAAEDALPAPARASAPAPAAATEPAPADSGAPPAEAPAPPAAAPAPPSLLLFPRPPAVVPRVRFWTRVYTEVETNGGLIHDSDDLDIVYDVIRWPKDLPERQARERYERAQEQYRRLVLRLAGEPWDHLTREERRILALFPPGVSRQALRAAADRIRFQRGQADKFRDGIVRSGTWEPHIRKVFRERGLPAELAALPHVESSFDPTAYSHAGAAGLWQFMRSTARRFRLRIDRTMDERFDPFRSSEAAAELLSDNYQMTGTWPLALTAYNHGPGGVQRAIKELGTRDIGTVLERYESRSFGFASRNFYSEFLAAVDVERNALAYFGRIDRAPPASDDVVVTDGYYSAHTLARTFGVDLSLLHDLNPALRDVVWSGRRLVPRGYALRVPHVDDRLPVRKLMASIAPAERQAGQVGDRNHIVARGETLGRIARRYHVSERALANANHIHDPRSLQVGRLLRIPGAAEVAVDADEATRRPARVEPVGVSPAPRIHTVRRGDTLYSIARRYGVSVDELLAANRLQRADRIHPGQKIRVPSPGAETRRSASGRSGRTATAHRGAAPRTYTVRRGDTLSSIARRHGVSVQEIVVANGLRRADRIRAGQHLRLPPPDSEDIAAGDEDRHS